MQPVKIVKFSEDMELVKTNRGYLRVSDLVDKESSQNIRKALVYSIFKSLTEKR